ncbi:MAG: methyltransferase domain-containing protein [Planctomycetota bacterium]|nr:methyltransferase domain-containing protein [Planctomycetota bacterium]
MSLLDDDSLERSSVVANSRMNRERRAVGVNSYERELRVDPIVFLTDRVAKNGSAAWLDLCCGRGCALIDAANHFRGRCTPRQLTLHGVDLVSMFDAVPDDVDFLQLESASLHGWTPSRKYDLITCVHGLHYIGDKLGLVERAVTWLSVDGTLVANLDLTNLRFTDGTPLRNTIVRRFRDCGLAYDGRRHVLSCVGSSVVSLGFRYVGADDNAGPNYSGQEAVDSYYEARH